jgi:hypothetical protein
MAYTTINKGSSYFNTVLYTGTETQQTINVGFQPDFVWIKSRSNVQVHALFDAVRGVSIGALQSNATATENANQKLVAYTSTGFTLPSVNYEWTNTSGWTFASWNWLGANTTVSNTSGSITSTVSANPTAGFSVVGYQGTSVAGTIGHGLGVAPKMIIIKRRTAFAEDWLVYHASLGATKNLKLNTTAAEATSSSPFNDTAPTSTVFSVSNDGTTNSSSSTYIAYCFADVKGFSKMGSYTGNNNADGTFVYTGFKPAWVLFKRSSSTENWSLYDNKRLGYNPQAYGLRPNVDLEESAYGGGGAAGAVDFVSNGFKIRESGTNINNGTYIYAAFAENPFVSSTQIPTTAR